MSFTRAASSFLKKVTASPASHRCLTALNGANLSVRSPQPFKRETSLLNKCANFAVNSHAKLHTEGDRRFVELLGEEIQQEKDRSEALPTMSDGWKVSFDGAAGTLSKTHDGDKIEVLFSLNGSIPSIQDEDVEEPQDEEPGVVSYPEFSVKVSKPGNSNSLEFECYFPEDVQDGVSDESVNLFSIRSVIMYEGEVTESTYIVDTENLDPNVYSYFLSYLADRSIDNQFADEFIGLTTAAEQREYVRSLEKLKDFIGSK